MIMKECSFPYSNNRVEKECISCSQTFCNEHYHSGIGLLLVSLYSSYSSDILDYGFCNKCWKKEYNNLVKLVCLIMSGGTIFTLVMQIILH